MQYNKMKIAVGLFVLTFFITIAFSSFLILQEKGTFDKRFKFHFTAKSAASFSVGMPLKFSGFDIGTIDKIELNDDGNVKVTFSVTQKNRKWINENSVLLLQKPLIGSPHIEIHSHIGSPELAEGSFVEISISDDINGMIIKLEPAIDRLINIIASVDTITSNLASKDSDLFLTLHNIKLLSEKLSTDNGLLTAITGDKGSTQSLVNSLYTTEKVIEKALHISQNIQQVTADLHKDIISPSSEAILELNAIMKDVRQKLEVLDGTVKGIGSYDTQLVPIKEQIMSGLAKSNQIMDKIDAFLQDKEISEVQLP